MKKTANKKILCPIFARYTLLILLAIPNLWIFYFIFTPLTIYPVFFLLNLFYNVTLSADTLFLKPYTIQLVNACIAGSAYYLLLILNLSTPMKLKKRIISIIFSFSIFLIINIIRIFLFSILFIKSFVLFSILHMTFWYFLSAVIVFLIWIFNIKLFKIKQIPFYTDIKNLLKIIY